MRRTIQMRNLCLLWTSDVFARLTIRWQTVDDSAIVAAAQSLCDGAGATSDVQELRCGDRRVERWSKLQQGILPLVIGWYSNKQTADHFISCLVESVQWLLLLLIPQKVQVLPLLKKLGQSWNVYTVSKVLERLVLTRISLAWLQSYLEGQTLSSWVRVSY